MNLETKVLRRKTFFINEPSDNFKTDGFEEYRSTD